MTPRPARTAARLLLLAALTASSACSDGSDGGDEGGASSARAVVDAHIAASRRYDLAAACELRTPTQREEMAAFDGEEAEGYCEVATRDITAAATPEAKARTRALYTDPDISELEGAGTWFSVESADGTYREEVEVVEIDGRWWIARIESDVDDHDHGGEAEGDVHAEDDGGTGPSIGG
jgi:hypothetical protein